jgi:hypothetical protein
MAMFAACVALMTIKILVESTGSVLESGSCENGKLIVCSSSVLNRSQPNELRWYTLRNQVKIPLLYRTIRKANGTVQCLIVHVHNLESQHRLSSPFEIFVEHYFEENSEKNKSDNITITCPTEDVLVVAFSSLGAIILLITLCIVVLVGVTILVKRYCKKWCKRRGRGPHSQRIRMNDVPGSPAARPTSSIEDTATIGGEDKSVPLSENGKVSKQCVENLPFSYPSIQDHEDLQGVLNVHQNITEGMVAMESQSVAGGTCWDPGQSEEKCPGWGVKKKGQPFPHSVSLRSFIEETFSNGRDQEGTLKPFLSELQELYTVTYDP